MKVLELKNLVKIYNDSEIKVKAVDHIDLSFEQGEFAAIVGPSGSGKTTLLNMIGGLDNPTEGDISVNNTSISELYKHITFKRPKLPFLVKAIIYLTVFPGLIRELVLLPSLVKKSIAEKKLINFRLNNIGFVFQAYNLIPVLTAKENVEFIMELQGVKRMEREERSIELLSAVGIADRATSRPSKLSGGQQQRVAVARALASKPKFILADEPTANLDSKSTETLLDIMEKLNKEENITFIFSTHDQRVVNKARRVITVEDGHVVSDERRVK
jgi:putative ABC transport system ATP-binding protein